MAGDRHEIEDARSGSASAPSWSPGRGAIGAGAAVGRRRLRGPARVCRCSRRRRAVARCRRRDHGRTACRAAPKPKQGGEEGRGRRASPSCRPISHFALRIALMRGHLLVGDELVKQQQWNAALPHFLHPSEEIYGRHQGRADGLQHAAVRRRAQGARRRGEGRRRAATTTPRRCKAGRATRSPPPTPA